MICARRMQLNYSLPFVLLICQKRTANYRLIFHKIGNCGTCGLPIEGEASLVGQTHYHPKCFNCADCKEPLGTTPYFIINGKNHCEKCRAKFLENCTKCGKVIENETIRPKESGKPYHADCFTCTQCQIPLQGKYFTTEQGVTCEECFAVRLITSPHHQSRYQICAHLFDRIRDNRILEVN